MLKTRNKRLLSLLLSAEIAASIVIAAVPVSAAAPAPGTPYDANGGYDVSVPHVLINQYYGSGISTGGAVDYGFIELYNPTDSAVDLSDWSVQYADRMALYDPVADELPLSGETGPWEMLKLKDSIPAHGSYLVRAAASISPNIKLHVKTGDIDFPRASDNTFQNKGMKVVLMSNQTLLDQTDVNPSSDKPAGFVDMLGAAGNDAGSTIDGAEGDYPKESGGPSKNIALRRVNFADTDSNVNDFALIDYKSLSSGAAEPFSPRNASDLSWGTTPPTPDPLAISTASLPDAAQNVAYSAAVGAAGGTKPYAFSATGLPTGLSIDAATGVISGMPAQDSAAANEVVVTVADSASGSVNKTYALNVNTPHLNSVEIAKLGSFVAGKPNADGGVAEIVKYNPENRKFYSVNGSSSPATLDIVSLDNAGKPVQETVQRVDIERTVADHVPGFAYGDFTSVDIDTKHDLVYAAVQEETYTKNGVILVFKYDGSFVKYYEAGVQPDMIKVAKDGRYVLTADEAEARLAGNDPDGSVTIVDTQNNAAKHVKFDDGSVIDDHVHLRGDVDENGIIAGPAASKAAAVYDLEPEYIALSADESTAYVSLQEGNAIGTIDIANGTVTSVKGLGYKDLNLPGNSLDLVKDGAIKFENVPFKGMYMPDGIDAYTVNGKTYLFTANEGDSTEWPGRTNVSTIGDMKSKLNPDSAAAKFLAGKTAYDGVEVPSDMGPDGIYLYGGRSFSVWDADTMNQVYDSRNDFEKITAERLPAYFNSNHADISFDKRSPKKGPEPEYVKVGQVGSKAFAFVGLERISGIMTYDVTDPGHPAFANYVNTRNFGAPEDPSNPLQTDAGPEGIDFIPATISPTGLPLILAANEVGGTIAVLQMNVTKVTLDQAALSFQTGDAAKKLTATVTPAGEGVRTVTWSSSNAAVAKVDASGSVTPAGAGTAVITALSADGYGVAEASVTVTTPGNPGGGTGAPSTPDNPEHTGTPTADGSKVTTEVKTTTDTAGNAAAAITSGQVEQALEKLSSGPEKTIEFKAVADANAKQNTVSLPAASVDKLAGSAAEAVVINAGIGQVAFDKGALAAVSNAATTGDVTITVAKKNLADVTLNLPADAQAAVTAAVGSHPVFDFAVTADGKKVTDFAGGSAAIRIPYIPAAGENVNAIVVYYIADNGELVLVPQANYDAATGTLSFKVKHFSAYAAANKQVNFIDIAGSFAKDYIAYLSARNLIQGTSEGSFDPKTNVTRADFTLILARAAGVDMNAYVSSGFKDVSVEAYYAKSVAWAASAGIASGISANQFSPNANITREQMVAMIARFADSQHYKLPATAPSVAFADASSISPYATEAAAAVQQAGIVNGKPSGSGTAFAPKQFATREETAKMIAILYQLMTK